MLKKLKEKLSKKKIITIGIAIIAIITTIVAILLNQTETQTKTLEFRRKVWITRKPE